MYVCKQSSTINAKGQRVLQSNQTLLSMYIRVLYKGFDNTLYILCCTSVTMAIKEQGKRVPNYIHICLQMRKNSPFAFTTPNTTSSSVKCRYTYLSSCKVCNEQNSGPFCALKYLIEIPGIQNMSDYYPLFNFELLD